VQQFSSTFAKAIDQGQLTEVKHEDGRFLKKLQTPLEISLLGKEELCTDTWLYRFLLPE